MSRVERSPCVTRAMSEPAPQTKRATMLLAERLARGADGLRHSVPLDILVVDDDQATRLSLSYALTDAGHRVCEAEDGEQALARLAERSFDVALVDVRLPKVDGLAVFRRVRQRSPSTSVILMTAFATVTDAVASLREGAYDYVTKPFDPEELSLRVIGHIAEHRALRQELEEARRLVATREVGSPIIGSTPTMLQLIERINTVAQCDAPVLILGESGTGKELVAHTLHARGPRKSAPFVVMNCAAFREPLLEAELFGHERGAFAGAVRRREGRLRAAEGGTLLLDEITELPMSTQAKLLRVLEDGVVQPLGSNESLPVNVRLIASATRDPKPLIAAGRFREDLYFRINVLDLAVPPLRDRRADMPLLLAHFLRRFYPGRVPPGIVPRAWTAMMQYAWPGNVRELAHAVERAVVLAHGSAIDLEHLPSDLAGHGEAPGVTSEAEASLRPLVLAMKEFERGYLLEALRLAHGGKGQAAAMLGISRKNLWEKLKHHGIGAEDLGRD
jgi:DNA-binding NtrC family response regulator